MNAAELPTIVDYYNAPSGVGPLAARWKDKPHRLLYELCERVAVVTAELAETQKSEEAFAAKVKSLSAHVTCACSYDRIDDVCFHHSPKLAAALAEIAQIREALESSNRNKR